MSVGGIEDVEFALRDVSELHQLEVICEDSVIYPETNASKATLRRSQILDAMPEMNGRTPVFFMLSPDEQLLVGNELMKFIRARAGSLERTVEIAAGLKSLEEVGLHQETADFLAAHTAMPIPLSRVVNVKTRQLQRRRIGG